MKIRALLQYLLVAHVSAFQAHHNVRLARDLTSYQNTSSSTDQLSSISSAILSSTPRPLSSVDIVSSTPDTISSLTTSQTWRPLSSVGPVITTQSACIVGSTQTYTGYIYPTVYVTVTSSYIVSVSATDTSSIVNPTIIETPADACSHTIVPATCSQSSCSRNYGPISIHPSVAGKPPQILSVFIADTTSTVTVTKKTPVPVVELPPDSAGPPVTFNNIFSSSTIETTATGTLLGAQAQSADAPSATPATVTIAGATVIFSSSNIIIGGYTVPIPAIPQSPTALVANGQTFTISQSQIIGPSTTYYIPSAKSPSTYIQPASVVTIDGVTATINSAQVVISGTTYHAGTDALPTSVIVNGQTLSIGPGGVGDASTTFSPPITIVDNHYEVMVVRGVIISVDASEAVISGTHFSIGLGATSTIAIISGSTITLGPSGVVLSGTTIAPTSIPSAPAAQTSASASTAKSAEKGGAAVDMTASTTGMAAKASTSRSSASSIPKPPSLPDALRLLISSLLMTLII